METPRPLSRCGACRGVGSGALGLLAPPLPDQPGGETRGGCGAPAQAGPWAPPCLPSQVPARPFQVGEWEEAGCGLGEPTKLQDGPFSPHTNPRPEGPRLLPTRPPPPPRVQHSTAHGSWNRRALRPLHPGGFQQLLPRKRNRWATETLRCWPRSGHRFEPHCAEGLPLTFVRWPEVIRETWKSQLCCARLDLALSSGIFRRSHHC